MEDLIVVIILVIVIGLSALYVIKEKKKGTKCIGCPHANTCSSRSACGSGEN